ARYASPELVRIWSPEEKVRAERRLWLAVLRAQRDLGVAVPDGVVAAYERVVDDVDLASIAARERVTRHDVKARIEEFNALAGHEHIHKGMTSRDLTENVEQLQIRLSLTHVRDRTVAVLARLVRRARPRAARAPARLRGHGRGALRGAVERGCLVRRGGAPGRAARRVLRPRRPLRGVPHRARRARRLPRRDRPRAGPLPAFP